MRSNFNFTARVSIVSKLRAISLIALIPKLPRPPRPDVICRITGLCATCRVWFSYNPNRVSFARSSRREYVITGCVYRDSEYMPQKFCAVQLWNARILLLNSRFSTEIFLRVQPYNIKLTMYRLSIQVPQNNKDNNTITIEVPMEYYAWFCICIWHNRIMLHRTFCNSSSYRRQYATKLAERQH